MQIKTKLFPLYDDTSDVLRVQHDQNWNNCRIGVNGEKIAFIEDSQTLKDGVSYELGEGNKLDIQLITKYFLAKQLRILVNDEPVENSDTHHNVQAKWVVLAACLPIIINVSLYLNGHTYNFDNLYVNIASIFFLALFVYSRNMISFYLLLAYNMYMICLQIIMFFYMRTLTDISISIFIPWLLVTLVFLLPSIYLVHEGIDIMKKVNADIDETKA